MELPPAQTGGTDEEELSDVAAAQEPTPDEPTASTGHDPAVPPGESGAAAGAAGRASPQDAARERFRAALERKQGRGGNGAPGHHGGPGGHGRASSGPAASKRQFRRKSG